jgi:Holliday junction resolvase RusA-like endonuclease
MTESPPQTDGFVVEIRGDPKAQPRPRMFRRGSHIGVYDPGTADAWKRAVVLGIKAVWNGQPYGGPLHVIIGFRMPRPKAHTRKDGTLKAGAPIYCTSKPDADNLAKAVLDAMTDLGVWRDDSQVCQLDVAKVYSREPGAQIILRPLSESEDHIRVE